MVNAVIIGIVACGARACRKRCGKADSRRLLRHICTEDQTERQKSFALPV